VAPRPGRVDAGAQLAIFDATPTAALPAEPPPRAARPPLALPEALRPHRTLLRLGTSSWSFPGWAGRVWDATEGAPTERALARHGLPAYAAHPLFGAVGLDRGFYAPLSAAAYRAYAAQAPVGFRFLVKAPAAVCDATRRDGQGRALAANPDWLDPQRATQLCVEPAAEGLGEALGTLLWQLSPVPPAVRDDVPGWIARLRRFLRGLPRALPGGAHHALELRDATLLTPRLADLLHEESVVLCVGLHDRMPGLERQLRALDRAQGDAAGPLTVRWSLRVGLRYEAARARYAPFDRLVDPDPSTRAQLAARAAATLLAGQPVTVIANNKAEGSAPATIAALAEAIATALPAAEAGRQVSARPAAPPAAPVGGRSAS
jgi:uncharacterized protein YecE (DUF72 family)